MREIARQRSRGKDRDCNDRRKPILAASHLSDNRCFRQPARGTECYNFEVRQQFLRRAPAFPLAPLHKVGEWLSLVEHLVRDQGVGGSNPLSPTNSFKAVRATSPPAVLRAAELGFHLREPPHGRFPTSQSAPFE